MTRFIVELTGRITVEKKFSYSVAAENEVDAATKAFDRFIEKQEKNEHCIDCEAELTGVRPQYE